MLGFGLSIEPQLWALIFTMVRVGAAFVAAPVFGRSTSASRSPGRSACCR